VVFILWSCSTKSFQVRGGGINFYFFFISIQLLINVLVVYKCFSYVLNILLCV
jgi:hypothetical protein